MGFKTFASASAGVSSGGGIPAATSGTANQPWHPTVVYLGLLLFAEFIVIGFLSHYLLKER